MDELEKHVLRTSHLTLINDLDVKDIAPVLFQNYMINEEQYEELCDKNLPRRKLCELFLRMITKPGSKCTFRGLLSALRHDNVYSFLAEKLEKCPIERNTSSETSTDESVHENETIEENREIIYEPVRKINVFTASGRKMVRIAHELKQLTHNGQTEQFRKLTQLIHERFRKQKLDLAQPAVKKMELADMRFTALEAEVSAKRVKYDATLCGSDVFNEMLGVIPFTSNPRVTSMTYLARYGSSVGMSDGVDPGLAYLQYAKHHAEHVVPCKDTGMVYYIEVNLLSQKYEASPSDDLKVKVLQTAQLAMSQFEGEDEKIRNDFHRMLMLKMVFCYLGIGLFGNRIKHVETTSPDREAAKNCLDFIEKPEVWNGMEKRRKMLFLMAKSEYYRLIGSNDLAKMHAKESRKIARRNGWKAELPNIENLVKELEERTFENSNLVPDDGFVQSLLDELRDDPVVEEAGAECVQIADCDNNVVMNELKECSNAKVSNTHVTASSCRLKLLKATDESENCDDDVLMNELKECSNAKVGGTHVIASSCRLELSKATDKSESCGNDVLMKELKECCNAKVGSTHVTASSCRLELLKATDESKNCETDALMSLIELKEKGDDKGGGTQASSRRSELLKTQDGSANFICPKKRAQKRDSFELMQTSLTTCAKELSIPISKRMKTN